MQTAILAQFLEKEKTGSGWILTSFAVLIRFHIININEKGLKFNPPAGGDFQIWNCRQWLKWEMDSC